MKTITSLSLLILFFIHSSAQNQKLPYPIIFVHGLNSNSDTWNVTTDFMDTQYNLTYGRRIDFCLNFDGSYYTTNLNFYPTPNADIGLYTDIANLNVGDYYYLNFDVGLDGSYPVNLTYDVESNQQSVAKQGAALSYAIYMVLQKTGRDKVVLIGHSMGGLAAREYLQNSSLWQSDGQHHIAKLVTTGTPHGGSIQVTGGFFGIDCQSEAYRDLRSSYSGSVQQGVYLFGGNESNSVMDLSFCSNFYNIDVNCNGTIGQNIVGLNQKSIPTDLDYSCIIGDCNGCGLNQVPGDGIVLLVSADLETYYPSLITNKFSYDASSSIEIHTDLPEQVDINMDGLDEPNEYNIAYDVNLNTTYTGFNTEQPVNGYLYDYDDYRFNLTADGTVTAVVNNIHLLDLMVRFVDLSGAVIGTVINSNGSQNMYISQNLTAGTYYLEIYGEPTSTSYRDPYTFRIHNSTVGVEGIFPANDFSIFPNPTNGNFNIIAPENTKIDNISIVNMLGEIVFNKKESCNTINISTKLDDGIYYLKINSDKGISTRSFVVVNEK
jgi:pimeloyl-ACP methyl ester carboxylesterase